MHMYVYTHMHAHTHARLGIAGRKQLGIAGHLSCYELKIYVNTWKMSVSEMDM